MNPANRSIEGIYKDYKPLGVAVFLAIGGLLSGFLWSSVFVQTPAGMVQERRVAGGPSLIPQAQGAEVDSAALMPQSAPFLASADANTIVPPVGSADVLYGEGALKDPEQAIKTKSTAPTQSKSKTLQTGIVYKITTKDTIASISAAYNVPVDTIIEFNPSVNFSSLSAGISIVIPGQSDIALLAGQS